MTQDQYGQDEGAGAVRGDVAAGNETEDTAGQSRPMTRFQKVASALLGDRSDRDEADQEDTRDDAARDEAVAGNRAPTASETAADSDVMAPGSTTSAAGTPAPGAPGRTPTWTPADSADEAAAASSPAGPAGSVGTAGPAGTEQRDYWDEPDASPADRDETVVVPPPAAPVGDTGADPLAPGKEAGQEGMVAEDYAATEPDMYGTTGRPGDAAPATGAATIADVPAAGGTAGPAGRHAGGPAEDEVRDLRPGEATGALGDFSDLTYGNLIPDAEQYTAQWQQVQFRFVDDPRGAVTEAADLVAQVTAKLEAAIQERQRAIEERQRAIQEQQRSLRGRWGEGTNTDTEALRETLRMYRMFLDQLIGSKTS